LGFKQEDIRSAMIFETFLTLILLSVIRKQF